MKIFFLLFLLFSNNIFPFNKENIIEKKVNNKTIFLFIPESFCELSDKENTFIFVKCYELELYKQKLLYSFSEFITIEKENNYNKIQNISNNLIFKQLKKHYFNLEKEKRFNILQNPSYPYKNKYNAKIRDNIYFLYHSGLDEQKNQFKIYSSSLFLNKDFYKILWMQSLHKDEKLLSEKKWINFVKINQSLNNIEDTIIVIDNKKILFQAPNFMEFGNYTNIKEYNIKNFDALFYNYLSEDLDDYYVFSVKTYISKKNRGI